MVEAVRARQAQGFDHAAASAREMRGKALMDDVRGRLGEVEAEERRLLAARERAEAEANARAGRSLVAGAAISLLLLLAAFLAVWLEVRSRVRAEQALRAYATEVSDLYDRAPCGYHSLDEDGRVVRINETELGWLGRRREEVLGRPFLDFLTPAGREAFRTHFPRFREAGRVDGLELEMVRADGSTLVGLLSATAVRGEDGRFLRSRSVVVDICERRRAERALQAARDRAEAANRELEAFSYSVSHDLRAPLRAIDGFSQALLEDCAAGLSPAGHAHLHRVRAAAQRMAALIDDLLELSRISRAELRLSPVDLSTLAREVAGTLRESHPDRRVAVEVADGVAGRGDPRLLRVLLDNLLGNAWKFTRDRPEARIEFGAARENGTTAFFVRDNGAGFDMAYAGKLFGAFQRLHSAREFEGTGIGLATVARIVRRHGGRVWAEGAVGEGATFRFTLGEGAAGKEA